MAVETSKEIPLDEDALATVPRSAKMIEALKRFRAAIEENFEDHAREINKASGDEGTRRNVAG